MTTLRLPRWRIRAMMAGIAVIAVILLLIRPMVSGYLRNYQSWRADRAIRDRLNQPLAMPFPGGTSLKNVFVHIRNATVSPAFPDGLPIYIDPWDMQAAGATLESMVTINNRGEPIGASLKAVLDPLGLTFAVVAGGV